jgi:hypothetical protein
MPERIEKMYLKALARKPMAGELQDARQFLLAQAALYDTPVGRVMQSPDVWADFAHVIFNLKEFVFYN